MVKQKPREILLYDWVPGQEGHRLIYVNRKPDPDVDPGIIRHSKGTEDDPLYVLYQRGKLTGAALECAKALFMR